jgi:hypothetical protein
MDELTPACREELQSLTAKASAVKYRSSDGGGTSRMLLCEYASKGND